jgi:hypothetical protein
MASKSQRYSTKSAGHAVSIGCKRGPRIREVLAALLEKINYIKILKASVLYVTLTRKIWGLTKYQLCHFHKLPCIRVPGEVVS